MIHRTFFVAFAIATLGGTIAVAGCGGDDCTRADDHFSECAASTSTNGSSSSGGTSMTQTCDGTRACQAQCINTHTCQQITGNDPGYVACLTDCLGK